MIQAQAAVNAGGVQVPRRTIVSGEVRFAYVQAMACDRSVLAGDVCICAHPVRKRPRFSMPFGSSARFTFCIRTVSVGVEPQTSKCCFASLGHRSTTAEESLESRPRNAEAAP